MKNQFGDNGTLVLNAGNNFDMASNDLKIAPAFILSVQALNGTEVIAPGVQEISYGIDKLKEITKGLKIPFIAANVPGLAPYALLSKNRGKTRVLVTSVVDPALFDSPSERLMGLTEPVDALQRIKHQVPHDLFVVIIHAEPENISNIADQCSGIDLVIDGSSEETMQNHPAIEAGDPPVVANNSEGKSVAYIDYSKEMISGSHFASPSKLQATVGEVAEDPKIAELVNEYNRRRQEGLLSISEDESPMFRLSDNSAYIGNQSCNLCHAEINDQWKGSQHAGAMGSLISQSRQTDPNCISCHVTGIKPGQKINGFSPVNIDSSMAGVQCEACHGPGAEHAKNPTLVGMHDVGRTTCTQCHTDHTDPEFDFYRDLSKVIHGRVDVGLNRSPEGNDQKKN